MKASATVTMLVVGLVSLLLPGCSRTSPLPVTQAATTPELTAAPTGTATLTAPPRASATPAQAAPTATSYSSPAPTASPETMLSATTLPPGFTLLASPTATPAPRDCTDRMIFVGDVTIPDNTMLDPGETFTKTWRVTNGGTCTWDESYQLVFAGDDPLGGQMTNPIPTAAPGQTIDLSVQLITPQRGGEHAGYWLLNNYAGQMFGAGVPPNIPLWVIINVSFYQVQANLQATASAQVPGAFPVPTAAGNSQAGSSSQAVPTPGDSEPGTDQPGSGASACSATEDPGVSDQILTLVNAARQQNGLEALSISDALAAAARLHSLDMACTQNASHTGSDGSSWYERVGAQGYSYPGSARENIYAGDPAMGATAEGAFRWWMNSPVHHDNILWPDVTDIGIGYAYYNGLGYYTLIVARP